MLQDTRPVPGSTTFKSEDLFEVSLVPSSFLRRLFTLSRAGVCRSAFIAIRRSTAIFSGALPFRMRLWSSPKLTSKTHPVHRVFDAPVRAHRFSNALGKVSCPVSWKTADVIASLRGRSPHALAGVLVPPAFPSLRLHQRKASEPWPLVGLGQHTKRCSRAHKMERLLRRPPESVSCWHPGRRSRARSFYLRR